MADVEWTGREGFRRSDPTKVADEMYREVRETARKSRLTWTQEELTVTPQTDEKTRYVIEDGRIGEFHPKLPYVLIHKRYIIQNSQVLDRAGKPLEITEIPDREDRARVMEALASFKEGAMAADPKLCRECAIFRAEDYESMVKHLFAVHPEKFANLMKEIAPDSGGSVAPVDPEPVKKPQGKFKCACGESFADQPDWLTHVKTHRVAAQPAG